jgi:hypothetical protein
MLWNLGINYLLKVKSFLNVRLFGISEISDSKKSEKNEEIEN